MLPFPILNNYGNTAPKVKNIKDVQCGVSSVSILYDNGQLYAKGSYTGNGAVTSTEWSLIPGNHDKIICSAAGTVSIHTDGSIWYAGSTGKAFNINSSVLTFTEVTSTFGVHANNIKKISLGRNSVLFLTNDNDLYGMGYNSTGELGSSVINSFRGPVLISSSVKDMYLYSEASGYITTSGTFYRCGLNGTYSNLGTGTTTNVTSFTPYAIGSHVIDCIMNSTNTYLLVDNNGVLEIHSCGAGSFGALGNDGVSTSTKNTLSSINFKYSSSLTKESMKIRGMPSIWNLYLIGKNNAQLFTCGYNASYQLGVGTTNPKTILNSSSIGLPEVNLLDGYFLMLNNANMFIYEKKIYAAGVHNTFGISSNTFTFLSNVP